MRFKRILTCAAVSIAASRCAAGSATVEMLPGEGWWGVANYYGRQMPFTAETKLDIDLRKDNLHNQCASFMVSSLGRTIWSDAQAKFSIRGGKIEIESSAPVAVERPADSMRGAFAAASRKYFPPTGKSPDPLFFTAPQLNTWIELTYHQNQKDVVAYAKSMIENGVEPGVLMIDDTWQTGYGDWRFEGSRFRDPKGMMDELHSLGYKVMLWMCPYVGMDTPAFRRIAWGVNPDDVRGYPAKGGFLADPRGRPAACEWWNGVSAFLDFSHPNANAWFAETLDGLVRDFGADGFKFDGADLSAYDLSAVAARDPSATNGSLNNGYAAYATRYPFCEIRNVWRCQNIPVVVRLHDKKHSWDSLQRMVADMIAAGIMGYPFICPDMVGGGEWKTFIPGSPFDPELFLRSAEIHAMSPMMQISASPWRVLGAEDREKFRRVLGLRRKIAPRVAAMAEKSGRDGEPILRSLEYNFPHGGFERVIDEYMLGDEILCAPVMEKGARSRKVVLPPGRWEDSRGAVFVGPARIEVASEPGDPPCFFKAGRADGR